MKCARLILLLVVVHAAVAQQQQPRSTSIQGVVVRTDNAEPIASAVVVLRKAGSQTYRPGQDSIPEFLDLPLFTVETSRDGQFSLPDLAPGIYRVSATHAGLLRAESGTFTIAARANPIHVRLTMDPAGTIIGRVVDKKGEPVGLATVRALRLSYQNGQPKLGAQQIVYTNDLGEFRLFALPAGRYLVNAAFPVRPPDLNLSSTGTSLPEAGMGPRFLNQLTIVGISTELKEVNADVYFPGTIDPSLASAMDLPAGGIIAGVNLTLATTPVFRIRATVSNVPAGQARSVRIWTLSKRPDMGTSGMIQDASAGGDYEIDVVPGSYILIAESGTTLSGRATVDVRGSDVRVAIVLQPTVEIPVHVTVDGGGSDPGLRVQPDPWFAGMNARDVPAPRDPGATASLAIAPGDYRIAMAPRSSANQYIQSIRLGAMDILKDGLHVSRVPDGPLEIVIGTRPGTLVGTVVDEQGQPSYGMQVALIPAQLLDRADLYKAVPSEGNGSFSISGIAPGEYEVFAWKTSDQFAYFDPELMKRFETRSKTVTFSESSTQSVELQRADLP